MPGEKLPSDLLQEIADLKRRITDLERLVRKLLQQ